MFVETIILRTRLAIRAGPQPICLAPDETSAAIVPRPPEFELRLSGSGISMSTSIRAATDGGDSSSVSALTERAIPSMMTMMTMMSQRTTMSAVLLLLGSVGGLAVPARAGELTATTFAQYQRQIKPQPGESRWTEIAWFLDLHAARQKAAAEGKPLFIYSAGGATGIGSC
jgi:hypothetical protein